MTSKTRFTLASIVLLVGLGFGVSMWPPAPESRRSEAPAPRVGKASQPPSPPTATNAPVFSESIRQLATTDAPRAASEALSQTHLVERQEALQQTMLAWAKSDPQTAWQWIATHIHLPAERLPLQTTLAYEAGRTNPTLALTLAATMPPSTERDQLLAHTAMEWTLREPNEALQWADEIPDPALHASIIAAIATAAAEKHPREAADLVSSMSDGPDQNRAAVAVAQRWAQQDYTAAQQWISGFTDEHLRTTTTQAIAPMAPSK